MNIFRTLLVKLTGDSTEFTAEMRKAQKEMAAVGRQFEGIGQALAGIGARMTAAITAPLGAASAAALKLSGDLEQNTIAFTTMLGSAGRAQTHLEALRDFAARTPFQFTDLTLASKRLQALGFTAAEVIPTLRSVGNAAAALGTGKEGIDRITTALGQMQAKGKVQAEEMRQLAEAGIPAWQILAKTLNTDVQGAMKAVEQRAVDSATAVPALIAGINARFGGLMEQQSKTLLGQWSNFKDQMEKIGTDIGQALAPMAGRILAIFVDLGKEVEVLVAKFRDLPPRIQDTAVALAGVGLAAGPALFAASQLTVVFGNLYSAGAKLVSMFGLGSGLSAGLSGLAVAAVAVTAAVTAWKIGAFITDLVSLASHTQFIRNEVDSWGKAISNTAKLLGLLSDKSKQSSQAIDGMGVKWSDLFGPVVIAIDRMSRLMSFFVDRSEDMAAAGDKNLGRIRNAANSAAADLKESLDKKASAIAAAFKAHQEEMAAAAVKAAQAIANAYSKLGLEPNKWREMEAAVSLLAKSQLKVGESLPTVTTAYAVMFKAFDAGKITFSQLTDGMEKFGKVAREQTETVGVHLAQVFYDLANNYIPSASLQLAEFRRNLAGLPADGAAQRQVLDYFQNLPAILLESAEMAERAKKALDLIGFAGVAAGARTSEAFREMSVVPEAELKRLAAVAKANYDIISKDAHSKSLDIQRAWVAMVEAQIDAGEKLPKSVIDQYEKLKRATSDYSSQIDKTWRNVWQNIGRDLTRVISGDLSNALGDILFRVNKVGDAFKRLGEDVVRMFLQRIIAQGIQKAIDALSNLGGMLGKLGGWLGGSGGGGGGVLGTTVGAAGGVATIAFPQVAGAVAPSAAGAAGSLVGAGVSGVVGAVAGVASAISGIIGNFQMAGMNKSLDLIVKHTLQTANQLIYGMQPLFNMHIPQISNLMQYNWQVQAPLLTGISSSMDYVVLALRDIRESARSGGGGATIVIQPGAIQIQTSSAQQAATEIMNLLKRSSPAFA